ncbi:hypothetical protein PPERSA_07489 [Pseudocohnilembus persalinus]|uniref:Uncharacterized protein n=1 Tax=Pseudocohnilembus persalinus TaxID=266149 RepID=A0A0V0R3B2_PSEPJ|nr:hypothetical protein PPERSA_07489 [Pseudocohnilembus persalinus]|eukprot:KRX08677.1 hypothetical protein PPERSA_07489 [Pseudocohnilembus persalinus]
MIVQRQNYLQYCIAILIGVVIQDLKYDFSEDKKYAASYYEGQWLQYNPIIDILIAFLSVTLLYEIFVNKTWKNYVVLILLLFSGICLAVILIPLQLLVKIDQLEKDKDQFDYLETIKFYHIYVLLALLVALLFSVLASVPKDEERNLYKILKVIEHFFFYRNQRRTSGKKVLQFFINSIVCLLHYRNNAD